MLGIDIRHIKDLREDQDLSQKELAKILNLSQRSYSHYENGTRKVWVYPACSLVSVRMCRSCLPSWHT